jgi:hypothetical protein
VVVGWGDGSQQDALDAGGQQVLRSVLSQHGADGVEAGFGVGDVAVMTNLLVHGYEKVITPA